MELNCITMESIARQKYNKCYCELDWETQVKIRQEIISQLPPKIKQEIKIDVNESLSEY